MNVLPLPPISHKKELCLLAWAEASRTMRLDECKINDATDIIRLVSNYFGIDEQDLRSKLRERNVVMVRQCLMWYFYNHLKYSYREAAEFFERDHATCIHACRVISNVANDSVLLPVFKQFCALIDSPHTEVPQANFKHTDDHILRCMSERFGRSAISTHGRFYRDFLLEYELSRSVVLNAMIRLNRQGLLQFLNDKQTWFKVI